MNKNLITKVLLEKFSDEQKKWLQTTEPGKYNSRTQLIKDRMRGLKGKKPKPGNPKFFEAPKPAPKTNNKTVESKTLVSIINRKLEEKKKVNPWAVCHSSTGPEKSAKFERCVKDVKKKEGIQEMLKGGQKKLDVNKSGKLDAQDFKMLRAGKKKKGMKEDTSFVSRLVDILLERNRGNAMFKPKTKKRGGNGGKDTSDGYDETEGWDDGPIVK